MPSPDPGLRARVARLLEGDFRPEDLYQLFLFARDRCDGREAVQEVGDFVAHHDERTKGIVTKTVRDWWALARFWGYSNDNKHRIDLGRLPPYFDDVLWASFRRIPNKIINQRTGLTRAELGKRIPAMVRGLKRNNDGTLSGNAFYTKRELKIIEVLAGTMTTQPAFDSNRLCSDFAATLKSHGLLLNTEMRAFCALNHVIGLFAVSKMHNCVIRLKDETSIRLKINNAANSNKIMVNSPIQIASQSGGGAIFLSSTMFEAGVVAMEACAPELLAIPDPWDFDVELTREKILSKLG
jgi:hypothetical protein